MQIVASRQVVFLVGAAGSGTGSRNEGRMREHQLACALLDGFEKQLGLTSECRGQGVGRAALLLALKATQVAIVSWVMIRSQARS